MSERYKQNSEQNASGPEGQRLKGGTETEGRNWYNGEKEKQRRGTDRGQEQIWRKNRNRGGTQSRGEEQRHRGRRNRGWKEDTDKGGTETAGKIEWRNSHRGQERRGIQTEEKNADTGQEQRNRFVGWLLACLRSHQQTSVSQGRICSNNNFYQLPHWDRSCWSNLLPHPVALNWHWANQPQCWPYDARHLAR